jgi:hypothetical protein
MLHADSGKDKLDFCALLIRFSLYIAQLHGLPAEPAPRPLIRYHPQSSVAILFIERFMGPNGWDASEGNDG